MPARKPRLDYDRVAAGYHRRYLANRLDGVEAALLSLVEQTSARRVLEVGCGIGRWLQGLQAQATSLWGLDYSMGMLRQAKEQTSNFQLVRGRASQLPYANNSFELIFCVNALHHFDQPQTFIEQAWQHLAPGGALAIVGQVPQGRHNRWYVYEYFEGTYALDLQRFPTWGEVLEWCIAAGFAHAAWQPVQWIHDPKIGRAVLVDPFLQKNATSQLALLSLAEYQAGVAGIQAALETAEAHAETLVFVCDLRLDMLVAYKFKEN